MNDQSSVQGDHNSVIITDISNLNPVVATSVSNTSRDNRAGDETAMLMQMLVWVQPGSDCRKQLCLK